MLCLCTADSVIIGISVAAAVVVIVMLILLGVCILSLKSYYCKKASLGKYDFVMLIKINICLVTAAPDAAVEEVVIKIEKDNGLVVNCSMMYRSLKMHISLGTLW